MILYGTKIKSDIDLSLQCEYTAEINYEINFLSEIPYGLKESITCGFHLYFAHGRNVHLYSDREFDGYDKDQPWCYEVENIARFYWRSGVRSIYYELEEKGNVELLSFWFVHLFLPFYMTLEEMYDFIHAGAVTVEDKSIFFIAPSMGGKSTITDYFINQGHALISDDKVATFLDHDRFMAVSSHPYHRPYRKFEELGYCVEKFNTNFKPIHVFYELKGIAGDGDIVINEVSGFSKFDVLLPNYLYMFSWLKYKRLTYLSKMVNDIRIFHIKVPWDKERLGDVYNIVCSHSRSI